VSVAVIQPPFAATARQVDVARVAREPDARAIVLDGAIRSGKTQAGGRLIVEWAVKQPATYLVARATYRSLKDSTEKAMLHGDGALPPLIPHELVEQFRASDELVRLRNGAEIMFRSLEEGQLSKLLNLTLGGILVDQIEELDGGDDGERVFDTLLGRLSDPRGPRKLIAVANPAGLTSWQYRRLIDERSRDANVRRVHFTLRDNAENLPADYVADMEATRLTRPAWYRSFIVGEWGAFEGQAFPEFEDAIHVVKPFPVPEHFDRFESLDHGANHPTVILAWASDEDGNLVVFDEYSNSGLVSKHARELSRRRKVWGTSVCWADPSVFASQGLANKLGGPASVATEYAEHGVALTRANNDRQAGYLRLLELLHVEPGRIPPPWAQVRDGVNGAPRLYVFASCRNLIDQLKSAPVAEDGVEAGEAVDRKWEGAHGHAVAALRYGAMSRPSPSMPVKPRPPDIYEDPEGYASWARVQSVMERGRRLEQPDLSRFEPV
jgi:PBSX family phage terminase large subunit